MNIGKDKLTTEIENLNKLFENNDEKNIQTIASLREEVETLKKQFEKEKTENEKLKKQNLGIIYRRGNKQYFIF